MVPSSGARVTLGAPGWQWHPDMGVRCSRGVALARRRLISAKVLDPAVLSSGHVPQREAVAIVAGVATAAAVNADDVNQIPGDLHYARVHLIGIAYGTAVRRGLLAALPCAICRGSPGLPPGGSAGTGAHSLIPPPFSGGWARSMIRPSGPTPNGHGNSSQGGGNGAAGQPGIAP